MLWVFVISSLVMTMAGLGRVKLCILIPANKQVVFVANIWCPSWKVAILLWCQDSPFCEQQAKLMRHQQDWPKLLLMNLFSRYKNWLMFLLHISIYWYVEFTITLHCIVEKLNLHLWDYPLPIQSSLSSLCFYMFH